MRQIDHLVLGVHDLDAAGAAFEGLGFRVGAINHHPFGTKNRIIQFSDQNFLELITVADAAAIPPHSADQFSFAAFVRDALMRQTGLSMIVLSGTDARADAAHFAATGFGNFQPFDFSRTGKGPDGAEREVAFSLAFAREAAMPLCGFFTCQQHRPENFWNKAVQQHVNGATGIGRVSIVVDNPSDHHIFLSAFTGIREMRSTSFGVEVATASGVVEIVSGEGFFMRYGMAAPVAPSPVFAGFSIKGAPLQPQTDLVFTPFGQVLPPIMAFGTAILFEA